MTQQWGNSGQQGGQWPVQQNWNRPSQAWGAQQAPQYGPNAGAYGPPGATTGQQPGYQTSPYSTPGQFGPPGGPRKSPMRGLLLGLVLVVGIAFFGIALMSYLGGGSGGDQPGGNRTTAAPQPTVSVPAPDTDPPELPAPETYGEATTWLEENAVYAQSIQVPTDCSVPKIDMRTASVAELTDHLNELTACLWQVWSPPLEKAGFELPRPPVTVYDQPITTGCGKLDEVNAVYCSADQRIYYAQPLWQIFPENQQDDPFVVESVLAHEFGHTIQARTGIMIASGAWEQKSTAAEGKVFSRRLEQQADCFAGMFTEAVGASSGLSNDDLVNLRDVFYNLGDDVLNNTPNVQGGHGLGRSRKAWFTVGQESTLMGKCNTYTAPPASVR
ncbi:MAG: neutral zinc metallopeptidase [Actinobacteria bacterium]|nr:neutral zinc metallopeptidase [Actinomycetota bacterium]